MIEDAGTDEAVALLMALEENEVEVVQGVKADPIDFRCLGQKAEQEGPVMEEPLVDLRTENDVKAEIRRKEKRRRKKAKTRNYTTSNMGNLETWKMD